MKKVIVIINGYGGSGKDTFISFANKYAKVINYSSIDKVKEIARLIGWNGDKTNESRKFLSDLKTLTTEFCDMSFKDTIEHVENFMNSDAEVMFIHVREPENIKRCVKKFNAITLLIKKDGVKIISNSSDASVENYNYDYIINNTTLDNLENEAKNFVQKILE